MNREELKEYFSTLLQSDLNKSPAVAAIETLLEVVCRSKEETILGLNTQLLETVDVMRGTDYSTTSVSSASELFMRFITLTTLEQPDFAECKRVLLDRGHLFLEETKNARHKIAQKSLQFIRDGMNILTHSYSRVVYEALRVARKRGRNFTVFVTESQPDKSGYEMQKKLLAADISCVLILDSAAGYIMEKMSCVLFGAEGIMENGGIINKIGTFGIAVCAKSLNKPVYVMAESVKFVKEYPLNQRDIKDSFKYRASTLREGKDLSVEHPLVDYTSPQLISLLFTDLGILTPTARPEFLMSLRSLYDILESSSTDSFDVIKSRYKKFILQYHPDKNSGNSVEFNRVLLAWRILSDAVKRKEYDAWFREQQLRELSNCVICDVLSHYDLNIATNTRETQPQQNQAAELMSTTIDCRCGGMFKITTTDIELAAGSELLIPCSNCSLFLKIVN